MFSEDYSTHMICLTVCIILCMQAPDDTSKALNELLREQNKLTDLESKLQAILNVTGHFLSTATLSD